MNKVSKRSRQFFRALFSKMEQDDHEAVNKYLDRREKKLFYNMDPAIQKHCVNVAATILDMVSGRPELNSPVLIKAGLLHDIGKSQGTFTVMDRVWYVLVKKVSRRLAKKLAKPGNAGFFARLRNSFHLHIYHSEIGATIAETAGLDKELVYLLRNHHNHCLSSQSEKLAVLLKADELN